MSKILDIRKHTHGGFSKRVLTRITSIARHHSATKGGDYFSFWTGRWRGLGWKTGGYHEIILPDGKVQLCYDPNVITNGISNHNNNTYHICLVGNGDFTDEQEEAWIERVEYNMKRFNLGIANVKGHREYSGANTLCPGIDMNTVRQQLNSSTQMPPPPKTAGTKFNNPTPTLKKGSRGKAVGTMQKRLIAHGFPLPVFGADNHFGEETHKTVLAFQRAKGLTQDGIVGSKTWAELNMQRESKFKYNRLLRLTRPNIRGEDVRAVQRKLGIKADGIFGPITEKAVRDYQQNNNLIVDGIVGQNTWAYLFKI
ncbi:N-acetylmuramoyl-L-alanine amidase [Alkalihalobacillus trypoxylicola]|uniref:Autolysin n=1 Tax=Alkalihalobacillus trypoxylicola TaxID=519424 RepID=A0A162EW75_9BACI|nr:N-acetylmuramoyl-L-alanine amidase [Alkalihalobacillus trypoxylicola]KYG33881.1 hypothetical protein AZF04_15315 [Alkalihalobacillus trypoxylicola]